MFVTAHTKATFRIQCVRTLMTCLRTKFYTPLSNDSLVTATEMTAKENIRTSILLFCKHTHKRTSQKSHILLKSITIDISGCNSKQR